MRSRTLIASWLALLLVAGCGDTSGEAPGPDPGTGSNSSVAEGPPTSYVVVRTGLWSGTVEPVGESSGTISFAVRETEASTHETLADGQVVVYDFALQDLQVVLELVEFSCPSGALDGEIRATVGDAIAIDAGSLFSAETDEIVIEGSVHRSAAGTIAVVLEDGCTYGPVPWSADVP